MAYPIGYKINHELRYKIEIKITDEEFKKELLELVERDELNEFIVRENTITE